ncbi:MAG: NAD-dependent epimerase/dehydratase family protein [Flavobacterium sp.]|nr:MAG: NAD-dependent epimerase/dehydratase family protein [Flavobacterium sp.]
MSKILLTGSTGFVGNNLLPFLKGFEVETLSLRSPQDSYEFKNIESIVHLAGKAHDLKRTTEPNEYYAVNYELTKKLYDAFLKSDAKKFVFISSVKAAADSVTDVLMEDSIPNPQTHYGKSKLMAEQYIQRQPLPASKSYYILRPCMIHGPGNKGNLNLLYNFVQKGIPYPLAAFRNKRSFLSVQNLCIVIINLLKGDISSGVYQVADDGSLSTNEVVELLAAAASKKPKLVAIPKKLIIGLAKIGDKLKLPLNSERLHKLTENYVVSNEKLKKALAIELPLTIKEGLTLTAKSFNAKKNN